MMRRLRVWPVGAAVMVCVIVIAGLLIFRPSKSGDDFNARESKVPVDPRLVKAHTEFAFDLFREIHSREPDKNVLLCPASVALCLSMAYNGASGKTAEAMAKALNIEGMDQKDFDNANTALMSNLNGPGPGVKLSVANALWAQKNVTFHTDFFERCKRSCEAEITSLDLQNPGTPNVINDWVKQKTNNRIPKIIDNLDPATILILTNAAYFKGIWQDQFDKSDTRDGTFMLADGTRKTVPMMSKHDAKVKQFMGDTFQAASIPYGKGRVCMYIFLPNKDSSLDAFLKGLNAENWQKWMSGFNGQELTLIMPRFKFQYKIQLNEALQSMGMTPAFDSGQADFARMCDMRPVWIDRVMHKTFIEVNEEGTEAAAATATEMAAGIAPFSEFLVDRPFFFAIRDNRTGEVVFMGTVMDPSEEQ